MNDLSGEQLATITADAFQYDPFNQWALGSRSAMIEVFKREAKSLYLPHGYCRILDEEAAIMGLLAGHAADLPLLSGLSMLFHGARKAGLKNVRRMLATDRAMKDHFPKQPVAYLATIAVRPSGQGKGLGGRLLKDFLSYVDKKPTPAWLESSNPENHGFYAAHGFRTQKIIHVMPDAPPLELMLRPARDG